jgi:hypothetical protein
MTMYSTPPMAFGGGRHASSVLHGLKRRDDRSHLGVLFDVGTAMIMVSPKVGTHNQELQLKR